MAKVTKLIHKYLRHNKKFPHVFCPGCGHGIVLGSLIRSVDALDIPKNDIVLIAGIGCSGRIAAYVDFNTIHATHGRALTLATGVKTANPKLTVIALMGDGDAFSIGGNHFIHAARRNIGVTALVLNNFIYGMTGGQTSSTTPFGSYSHTSPYGQLENSFDIVEMARASGANGVFRASVFHAQMMDELMRKAISNPGFNLLEAVTPCFTQYGRKNNFKSPVDMYKWLKKNAVPIEKYEKLEDKTGRIPIGAFVERHEPGFEERWSDMRQTVQASKKAKGGAK